MIHANAIPIRIQAATASSRNAQQLTSGVGPSYIADLVLTLFFLSDKEFILTSNVFLGFGLQLRERTGPDLLA